MSIWDNTEQVIEAIRTSTTRYQVLEKLQRSPTSASYRRLKIFELDHNIDTRHYQSHSTTKRDAASKRRRTYTNLQLFVEDSRVSSSVVRRRILRDKLIPYVCDSCYIGDVWCEKPLTLHLEHKNGVHTDNRLENLCFLCPNCHSQTETYAGRNVCTTKRTKQLRDDHIKRIKDEADARNQPLVEKILASDIDFTKYGWVKQAANLIGKNPQKMKQWMLRYMPEFYKRCYRRT